MCIVNILGSFCYLTYLFDLINVTLKHKSQNLLTYIFESLCSLAMRLFLTIKIHKEDEMKNTTCSLKYYWIRCFVEHVRYGFYLLFVSKTFVKGSADIITAMHGYMK